jgi:hypothetical protein
MRTTTRERDMLGTVSSSCGTMDAWEWELDQSSCGTMDAWEWELDQSSCGTMDAWEWELDQSSPADKFPDMYGQYTVHSLALRMNTAISHAL